MTKIKHCVVPQCGNSTTTTQMPGKIFFTVPNSPVARRKWMAAMKIRELVGKAYVCDDHFNVENDMVNYTTFTLVGGCPKLKKDIVPHKFECQMQAKVKIEVEIMCPIPDDSPDPLDNGGNSQEMRPLMHDIDMSESINSSYTEVQIKSEQKGDAEYVGYEMDIKEDLAKTREAKRDLSEDHLHLYVNHVFKHEIAATQDGIVEYSSENSPLAKIQGYSNDGDSSSNFSPMKPGNDKPRKPATDCKPCIIPEKPENELSKDFSYYSSDSKNYLSKSFSPVKTKDVGTLADNTEPIAQPQDMPDTAHWSEDYQRFLENVGQNLTNNINMAISRFSQSNTVENCPTVNQAEQNNSFNPGERYICDQCQKIFPIRRAIINHVKKSCKKDDTVKCTICNVQFHRKYIRVHERTHARYTEETNCSAPCQFCAKTFANKKYLKIHERTHTGERPFACKDCSMSFTNAGSLTSHKLIHAIGPKPFSCRICEQKFSNKSTMYRHVRAHTKEKRHKCSYCERRFVERSDWVIHERVHTGDRPFLCDMCHKSFASHSSLASHRKTHTGEKRKRNDSTHVCRVCNKVFANNFNLKIHQRIHTGEKPYRCQDCDRGFKQRTTYVRHLRRKKGCKMSLPTQIGFQFQ